MVEARDGAPSLRAVLAGALWLSPHASRQHPVQRGDFGILRAAHCRLGPRHLPPAEGPATRGAGGDCPGLRDPTAVAVRALDGRLGEKARSTVASRQVLVPNVHSVSAHARPSWRGFQRRAPNPASTEAIIGAMRCDAL